MFHRQMHDEVSETENLRKNLAVERMIVEGCDILLDVNQVFVRQGKFNSIQSKCTIKLYICIHTFSIRKFIQSKHVNASPKLISTHQL